MAEPLWADRAVLEIYRRNEFEGLGTGDLGVNNQVFRPLYRSPLCSRVAVNSCTCG